FDRSVRPLVTAQQAYASLSAALDPTHSPMRLWIAGLVGAYAVFVAWCVLPRIPRRRLRRAARLLLGAASAAVVAGPLLGAAERAHPAAPVSAIAPDSRVAASLAQRLGGSSAGSTPPLYRLYTAQSVYLGRTDVEPNALLPLGVQEAGGYSSLSSERHMAYSWGAETSGGTMLDVWNAAYYASPNAPHALPSHELASFHPERPLVAGSAANAGSHAWYRVPSVLAENVRVIATLRDAWGATPGEIAAWVAAEDDQGQRHLWPLRVGLEIAEATAADPALRAQRPPALADDPTFPLPVHVGREYGADGKIFEVRLYYAKLPLEAPTRIVRLGIEAAPLAGAPNAILRVHGLGIGQPDWNVHNVVWSDRDRFTAELADDEVRLYRNTTALPRAYLLPVAVTLPQGEHVKQMAERAFDPQRMLLLDPSTGPANGSTPPGAPVEPAGAGTWFTPPAWPLQDRPRLVEALDETGRAARTPSGESRVVTYAGDHVEIDVDATADAWLLLADTSDPAWRATVDGRDAPVFLADAMFRAVAVPAGSHRVVFTYRPAPLERGAALSLATGLLLLAGALAGLVSAAVRRGPSPVR
ncbi:MAG TPA: YfhO family protein, partial [Chloroflexota bacterium]|nr:YfhO family protein [Chloroflexota bacterium]